MINFHEINTIMNDNRFKWSSFIVEAKTKYIIWFDRYENKHTAKTTEELKQQFEKEN